MAKKFPAIAGVNRPNFIPEIWAARFLTDLRPRTVTHMITNHQFESDFKRMGDTVKFSFPGKVPNRKWAKGQPFQYGEVSDEEYEMIIDRARQWGFVTHRVDDVQAIIKAYASTYKEQAVKDLAVDLDVETFGEMALAANGPDGLKGTNYDGMFNFGAVGAPCVTSKNNALQLITNVTTAAAGKDKNWSPADMWMVVPPWFINCLANSDLKDMSVIGGGGVSPLKAGIHTLYDTRIAGPTLIASNLLPTDNGETTILFGTKRAFSVAVQIEKIGVADGGKDTPMQDFHYGLLVYGMKCLYPKEIGCAVVKPHANAFNVAA